MPSYRLVFHNVLQCFTINCRIDVIRLTRNLNNFENILTAAAEGLFVVSTFYYLLNNLAILKVGCLKKVFFILDIADNAFLTIF